MNVQYISGFFHVSKEDRWPQQWHSNLITSFSIIFKDRNPHSFDKFNKHIKGLKISYNVPAGVGDAQIIATTSREHTYRLNV